MVGEGVVGEGVVGVSVGWRYLLWGARSADDGNTGVAQSARCVVRMENLVARTPTGAERGGERLVEQVKAPL